MANESIITNIDLDLSHRKDPGKTYLRIELQDIRTTKIRSTYIVIGYENYYHWEDICHEWLKRNPEQDRLFEVPVLTGLKSVKKRNDLIDGDSVPRIVEWQSTPNKPTLTETLFDFDE